MNIIIPMAGMGKRLRPHTLTVPKPLIPVAGKPIVQHLAEDLAAMVDEPVKNIFFITGRFGKEAENHLIQVAEKLGARGHIAYQDEALGTAHAVHCAREGLKGKVIVAFADTLFTADFRLDKKKDGVLWVKQIENPSAFGVVKLDTEGNITDFVEKPKEFVSDLAMIGIYYFKNGEALAEEIAYLLENNVTEGGEYQLPDALRRMTEKGAKLGPGKVDAWMDCGNPAVTVETNGRVLDLKYPQSSVDPTAEIKDSIVIPPCYIGAGTKITGSVVGPHVSIGTKCAVTDARLINSIVQNETKITAACIENSMIGSHTKVSKPRFQLSVGDYNTVE